MQRILFIIRKEFQQIRRNKIMMRIMLILPVAQLMVLSFAADFEIKKINLAVVDHDRSEGSLVLTGKFFASGYFIDKLRAESVQQALDAVENDEVDLVLVIDKDFEKKLLTVQHPKIQLLANAVNNQKAAVSANYARNLIQLYNKDILISHPEFLLNNTSLSIHVNEGFWFNPRLNYKTFMVPGILAVLVTMLTAFLSSINIIREKEIGTIEQLNVTPIRKYEFIIGKLIPFWLIGLFIVSIGLTIAYLVFGITVNGSLLTLYSFTSLYLIAVLGLGMLISTLADTQQQAMFITWFFTVIFILLSGLFTPRDGMPEWAKTINVLNPLQYYVDVMRMVMLKGSGMTDLVNYFLIMILFVIGFNSLAIWNFRKTAN